jgi:hypothetical protein
MIRFLIILFLILLFSCENIEILVTSEISPAFIVIFYKINILTLLVIRKRLKYPLL